RHLAARPGATRAGARVEGVVEAAAGCGLEARAVSSATESLEAMLQNRPTVCCVLLEAYVGVLEDPETGEETEQEVGGHCVMVVGGDLLGPGYVAFDPWGPGDGAVSFWSGHDAERASPLAWVELATPAGPAAPAQPAPPAPADMSAGGALSPDMLAPLQKVAAPQILAFHTV
ncbi:unnamed protein product, partial [Prorocentrum cordatum]